MEECTKNRRILAQGLRDCRSLMLALGDLTRQQIFLAILESEPSGLRVGEIAARTHLSRPAVSHHLKILHDAGIITYRRQGTMRFYCTAANVEEWGRLKALLDLVYDTVLQAKQAGCPDITDEN